MTSGLEKAAAAIRNTLQGTSATYEDAARAAGEAFIEALTDEQVNRVCVVGCTVGETYEAVRAALRRQMLGEE